MDYFEKLIKIDDMKNNLLIESVMYEFEIDNKEKDDDEKPDSKEKVRDRLLNVIEVNKDNNKGFINNIKSKTSDLIQSERLKAVSDAIAGKRKGELKKLIVSVPADEKISTLINSLFSKFEGRIKIIARSNYSTLPQIDDRALIIKLDEFKKYTNEKDFSDLHTEVSISFIPKMVTNRNYAATEAKINTFARNTSAAINNVNLASDDSVDRMNNIIREYLSCLNACKTIETGIKKDDIMALNKCASMIKN